MKYKILTPDANGVFTFTKEELEKFMEEIYDEGYNEGMKHTITTPSYPVPITYPDPITHPYVTWTDPKTVPVSTTTTYVTAIDPALRDYATTNPAIRNDPFTFTGDANGK